MTERNGTGSNKVSSFVYLWIAVIIFAASNAVTRKVTEIGAHHLVNGHNPISLCNVLFAGNLCALMVMLLIFGKEWNRRSLRQLSRRDWIGLGAIAVLSGALAPGLIFAALDNTTVTNVVLISRLEAPLTLIFSVLFLKARINRWTVVGAMISFAGVVTTAFLASSEQQMLATRGIFHIGRGEVQVAIAALLLALATIISKVRLQQVPLGIFNILRVSIGTIVFFILAKLLYGSQHFAEVFSPFLWKWMLLYGAVIVVAGQLCWFAGLRHSTPTSVALASSANPIAAIGMAFLILGEVPTHEQYIGGAIILIGIVVGLIGNLRETRLQNFPTRMTIAEQIGMLIGFRGI